MNYYQLKYFQLAAMEENLTRAAVKANLSQQALSSSIASLEKEIDVKLFDRHGRKVVLNPNGKIVLAHVNKILNEYDLIFSELSHQNDVYNKTLSIGTTSTNAHKQILATFIANNDDIRISNFYVKKDNILSVLEKDTTDFLFSSELVNNSDINFVKLFDEQCSLVVPYEHPFASRDSISLIEACDYPFSMCLPENPFRHFFENMCRKAGFKPKIVLETDIDDTIALAVRKNMALSIAINSSVSSFEGTKIIPLTDDFAKRPMYLVWKKREQYSEQWHRFHTFVLDNLDVFKDF